MRSASCVPRDACSSCCRAAGCCSVRSVRPGAPQAEKVCLSEGRVKPSASIRELAAIDGPGLCGHGASLARRRAQGRRDAARQGRDHRLPDGRRARGLARSGRAAGGDGAVRRRRDRTRRVRRLFLPHGRQPRRARICPNMPSAMRSTSPASDSRTGAKSSSCATGRRPTRRNRRSCTRPHARRLRRVHDRARAGLRRVPLQSLPSRSGDARPHEHRAAPLLPAGAFDGSPAAAESRDGRLRRAAPRREATYAATPMDLHGPDFALPEHGRAGDRSSPRAAARRTRSSPRPRQPRFRRRSSLRRRRAHGPRRGARRRRSRYRDRA